MILNGIEQFFEKIGLSNTVIGSAILLFLGALFAKRKQSKDIAKTEAETNKINTEDFITKERFRKEELREALMQAQLLKEENKQLREKLEESMAKIDKLIRRINVLETFYTLEK